MTKELWVYLMAYNRVSLLMSAPADLPMARLDAAGQQGVPRDRVSFIDALDALRQGPRAGVALTLVVNPLHPGHCQPRVIKRHKDRYSYMTRPRDQLRQLLGITHVAA